MAVSRGVWTLLLVCTACASGSRGTQTPARRPGVQAAAPVMHGGIVQVGDRIVLRVAGEAALTDTFTVDPGPVVVLPIVGSVALAGVRRDSVEGALTKAISKFYRDPSVHSRTLVRLGILGEVQRPGFYGVPVDLALSDVIMVAGGPTPTASVDKLKILRRGADVFPAGTVEKALAQGMTVAEVDIQTEDQFVVPRTGDSERTLRLVSELIAIPVAILTIVILLTRH